MSESVYCGYVINKQPYQVFDEVVIFLISNGKRIACLSRGSLRINSKNARHLFVGSYVEFQIFQSRHEDKLSRLKKVITIKPIDWNYATLESFNLLNECTMKLNINQGTDLYIFFENHLQMIQKQLYGEKIIILIILMRFIKLSGNDIQVNQCIRCSNHKLKTISFKEHGMLCNLCFNPQHDQYYELPITKAIHHLFNESYDKLNGYLEVIDFVIKLLSIYIDDNTGIKLQALQKY